MLSDPGNAEALYKWGTLQQHVLHRPERAGAGPREQVPARESRHSYRLGHSPVGRY